MNTFLLPPMNADTFECHGDKQSALDCIFGEDVAAISRHVRSLIAASSIVHRAARSPREATGAPVPDTPARRAVQRICEALLQEMHALACDTPSAAAQGLVMPVVETARTARLGRLLQHGRALVDTAEMGIYDDPNIGAKLLEDQARCLGTRYVRLLTSAPTPSPTSQQAASNNPESAAAA